MICGRKMQFSPSKYPKSLEESLKMEKKKKVFALKSIREKKSRFVIVNQDFSRIKIVIYSKSLRNTEFSQC